ncbi:MAG: hypothetical protein WC325_12225 [Candidatus Bathyarchaeia archaeon]|jgi:hypothetical protein
MSVNVDYVALAIITIFTSFFSGLGKEIVESLIAYVKKRKKTLVQEPIMQ